MIDKSILTYNVQKGTICRLRPAQNLQVKIDIYSKNKTMTHIINTNNLRVLISSKVYYNCFVFEVEKPGLEKNLIFSWG